jgi:thiosulfate reductase cytochrome b subunit
MTQKKYNLVLAVVLLTLIEGLAIYLNMVVHPNSQPELTVAIVIIFAIASGLGMWYATRVRGITFS